MAHMENYRKLTAEEKHSLLNEIALRKLVDRQKRSSGIISDEDGSLGDYRERLAEAMTKGDL